MIIKLYEKVNVNKLHTELNSVNIFPFPVSKLKNGDGEFVFTDDVDINLVQQIVDTHDPTPMPEPISELDKVKLAQAEQFEYLLETLEGMM